MTKLRDRAFWARLGAVALLPLLTGAAPVPPARQALHILSEPLLSTGLDKAMDVRWASDKTVFLALDEDGVVEASIEPVGGPPLLQVIEGGRKLGGWGLNHRLGTSPTFVVSAGSFAGLTWKAAGNPTRREEAFDAISDIDVSGNKLLVLGPRRDDKGNFAPDGTIAWLGSLDKQLKDLRPVLADAGGPGAPRMNACLSFEMGSVRFLRDGSFLVVPGIQPGAYLYDPQAKLLQTWDTGLLGLDTDCAGLTREQSREMAVNFDARVRWLNRRRLVDDILPLTECPGLIVRSVSGGKVRWQLEILRRSGEVATSDIPIAPLNMRSHLRGDVRGGRIVFVMLSFGDFRIRERLPASLIFADTPRS